MKVAVTAASGQLGEQIVRAALDLVGADRVVALARTPTKAEGLGVEVRPGDYDDPRSLEQSAAGIEALLLVSGMAPPDRRVEQHRNVIHAAKAAGVKRMVYTSIQGADDGTRFSPIVASNRQTEMDLHDSGLEWVVGRNGIYIEPDIDYVDTYRERGEVANCAGEGRCGYTTRPELGFAYARLLTEPQHAGQTYNLHGEAITQQRLVDYLNRTFGTELKFHDMTPEEYRAERVAELGEFLGGVIAGIYEGIRLGASDNPSHFGAAAGRPHVGWDEYFAGFESRGDA